MSATDRQRVERVPGARRARLTPAPGTTREPAPVDARRPASAPTGRAAAPEPEAAPGPNDDRLRRDVPPHY